MPDERRARLYKQQSRWEWDQRAAKFAKYVASHVAKTEMTNRAVEGY
jgi:hypothetical protein